MDDEFINRVNQENHIGLCGMSLEFSNQVPSNPVSLDDLLNRLSSLEDKIDNIRRLIRNLADTGQIDLNYL